MAETFILGAGIVGISTAYYLSEHQPADTIHLVENAPALLASASGYAGGFLARDWFGPEVAPLAALSFDQHRALAAQYDGHGKWGYVASTSLNYVVPADASGSDGGTIDGPDLMGRISGQSDAADYVGGYPAWLRRRDGDSMALRASCDTAAQVDPLAFSDFFLALCRERGVHVHQPARVVSVGTGADGALASVSLDEAGNQTTLPCTRLIITAGAWSGRVFQELFSTGAGTTADVIPMSSISGHSLLVRPSAVSASIASPLPVYSVFAAGGPLTFRTLLFGRADGSVYLAGLNSTAVPVPPMATDSVPKPDQLDLLLLAGKKVMGAADTETLEVVRSGLCHRPVTPWGFPMVLRLPDAQLGIQTQVGAAGGVFVAAGHGAWGISMGPGTGLLVAELAQGRPLSADVSGLGLQRV